MSEYTTVMAESSHATPATAPPTAIWSGILVGTTALLVFLILPLYVGALAGVGFDDGQLGNLAAMDLAGMALASVLALFWIKRLNWRRMGVGAMLALALINLLCLGVTDYVHLMTLRVAAGLAAGTGVVLSYSIIANTTHPDRYMGLFVSAQVLAGSIGFILIPSFAADSGVDVFYYLFGGLALLASVLVKNFPAVGHAGELHQREAGRLHVSAKLAIFSILIAMTLFFIGQGSIWAYGERIGAAAGLDAQVIGNVLAGTSIAALVGGLLSAWLDVRFGRFWPILLAIGVQLVALTLFYGEMETLQFALIFAIFSFSWNFGIAYQVGALISCDSDGRFTALIPAFQGAGLAIGPALAGSFLSGEGYYTVNIVSGVALFAYLLFILPFCRRAD